MITNGAGTVVWQWDNSDPFGANMANENPAGQGAFNFGKSMGSDSIDPQE